MKLNKNGWGISTEIIMIFGFIVCLLIALFYINKLGLLINPDKTGLISGKPIKDPVASNTTYKDLEHDLKTAAKLYVRREYNNDLGHDVLIITVKKLVDTKYLERIEDPDRSNEYCSGYVEIEVVDDKATYEPYLNCSTYTTKGYIKRKDAE